MRSSLRPVTGGLRRAIEGWPGALLPCCIPLMSGAESFVLGIMSRYTADCAQVAPVDAALRAAAQAGPANIFQMIATLSLRPTFATRLLATFRSRDRRAEPGPRSEAALPTRVEREVLRTSRLTFERIFARERRKEAVPLPADPPGSWPLSGAPSEALFRPTPSAPETRAMLTLRRVPEASAAREELRKSELEARLLPSTDNGRPGSRGAATGAQRLSTGPLSAGDLGRLTDQVVRAIDRRIVAQRERKGVI